MRGDECGKRFVRERVRSGSRQFCAQTAIRRNGAVNKTPNPAASDKYMVKGNGRHSAILPRLLASKTHAYGCLQAKKKAL
jgi:hypothetical protein